MVVVPDCEVANPSVNVNRHYIPKDLWDALLRDAQGKTLSEWIRSKLPQTVTIRVEKKVWEQLQEASRLGGHERSEKAADRFCACAVVLGDQ